MNDHACTVCTDQQTFVFARGFCSRAQQQRESSSERTTAARAQQHARAQQQREQARELHTATEQNSPRLLDDSLRTAFVFACRGPSCPSCASVAVRTPISARTTTSWRAGRRTGGQAGGLEGSRGQAMTVETLVLAAAARTVEDILIRDHLGRRGFLGETCSYVFSDPPFLSPEG